MVNKKGQVGTVIMYVAGLIIIALFLYFGTSLIVKLVSTTDDINYENMKISLINDIDSVAKSYGSERTIKVNIPSSYDGIVFADCENLNYLNYIYQIVENECGNYPNDYNNIFLTNGQTLTPIGKQENIRLSDTTSADLKISSLNGIAYVKVANEGRVVIITQGSR